MDSSIPAVRISMAGDSPLRVTFFLDEKEVRSINSPLTLLKLAQQRRYFYEGLDAYWRILGRRLKIDDIGVVSDAVSHLYTLGKTLSFDLFGPEEVFWVQEFFRKIYPAWTSAGSGSAVPLSIEVTSRMDHPLPLEFLPVFGSGPPAFPIRTVGELTETAARFLGFTAIVRRRSTEKRKFDSRLENVPRLGVRFLQHAGLACSRKERQFLEQQGWIEIKGIWPEQALDLNTFASELAALIWLAGDPAEGSSRTVDQMQHFSCHCDTSASISNDYALSFAHNQNTLFSGSHSRRATIGKLKSIFSDFSEKRSSEEAYPVIFLNACGTAKLTADGVTSFPEFFLLIGNRAIIGTETPIPDIFAAAFSEQFYRWLRCGSTLGDCAYHSRWSLLKGYQNPLGILYTIYGDSDIRVRKPESEKST